MRKSSISMRRGWQRVALAVCGLWLAGCCAGGGGGSEVRMQGAGATFPNPLYQKWFSEYNRISPGARFDYQSIGSGGGIKQITTRTIDFGGSDAPMTEEEIRRTRGEILHIPTALGAVGITYHVPEVRAELRLTPEVIAGIYLGRVSRWNDPAIAATNPGLRLPDREITVVYRSDGSGTTFVFTEYLSKISPEWKQQVGSSTAVRWPVGIGAKGNEGITGQIKQTPYAVGYVEHLYAEQNKLPVAAVRNAAGEFVRPSLDSITAAAAGAAGAMPEDLRVSITDAPGETAYPISSFTYLLVYRTQRDQAKGKALVAFLWWAVHEGERYAREMSYAPLPPEMVAKAEAKINSITFQGAPLRQ